MRFPSARTGCVIAACVGATLAISAQAPVPSPASLRVVPVQGNVSMLAGPAGNVTVQAGKDGVLLVDTMTEALAPAIGAQVKALSRLPIRYIIDTSMDPDHAGGNAALAAMGATGANPVAGGGATVIAHENVVNRMARPTPSRQPGLPNDEYFTAFKDLYFNGEPIFVMHVANAHTDGDSIVLFRRSDTISAGDVFTPDRYPSIDVERGGSVQGYVAALNRLLDLAVPEHLQEGGTRIVPGHGRLCNEADVVEYRDMVVIVRDRIQDLMKKGQSLEQIKTARPALDYEGRYGNPDVFVTSIVNSLRSKASGS
jgi:glyoxylase-like metal-dependent hydrolase (beta-lactamase superfamily II)